MSETNDPPCMNKVFRDYKDGDDPRVFAQFELGSAFACDSIENGQRCKVVRSAPPELHSNGEECPKKIRKVSFPVGAMRDLVLLSIPLDEQPDMADPSDEYPLDFS